MKLYCAHRIPLPADAFWEVLHAPRYEALVAEAAGLREYAELERRDETDAIYRRLHSRPALPDVLRGLLQRIVPGADALSYIEEQWRSKSKRQVRFRMQPSVLGDRTRIEGVVRIEPRSDTSCVRILDGVVEVKLLGLGTLVERAIVAATIDAYAKGAAAAAKL